MGGVELINWEQCNYISIKLIKFLFNLYDNFIFEYE